jgi:cyclase
MNRRRFLLQSTTAAALGLFARTTLSAQPAPTPAVGSGPTPVPAGPPAPPKVEFRPLRRNVGLFTGRGGSIGWLASSDGLAAVDTQFADTAALFLAGLPGRGDRMLDVVINTHHHGDHTSGNPVMKPATKAIVAHVNAPLLQRAAAERATPPTVDKQVFADTTFDDTWRLPLGDEVVSAKYFGPAHTKGDIVVLFEKANVVHMGDLMFNRVYPVIDRVGGANIRGWIGILEKVAKEYPADAIFIFGHGKPEFGVTGARGDLLVLRDYLSGLLDYVQKEITAGKTKAEISTLENLPGFPDFHQPRPGSRLSANISVAFDELTETKG